MAGASQVSSLMPEFEFQVMVVQHVPELSLCFHNSFPQSFVKSELTFSILEPHHAVCSHLYKKYER